MEDLQKYKDIIDSACKLLWETQRYPAKCLEIYEDEIRGHEDEWFMDDYGDQAGKAYAAKIKFPTDFVKRLRLWDRYFVDPGSIPWTGHKVFYDDKRINDLPLEIRGKSHCRSCLVYHL
jgi:hypothetical protein